MTDSRFVQSKRVLDVVVQSTHKTMLSLTQSSVLHVNGNRIDIERLEYYLSSLQTSSPSYLLMSSLDQCVDLAIRKGREMSDALLERCNRFSAELIEMGLQTYEEHMGLTVATKDISRINLSPNHLAVSGYQLEEVLRLQFGVYCEFATENAVICVGAIGNTEHDFELLLQALIHQRGFNGFKTKTSPGIFFSSEYQLSPAEAVQHKRCWRLLDDAVGKICADFITPYPPGIPMLIPGMVSVCQL